jgi:flagellar hook-associated protein 1 FlgK
MSDLLAIGKSGVTAYRNALSAVGENVVNAETKGYARRIVTLSESDVSAGTSPFYRSNTAFGGVEAGSVQRVWDNFKAADARLAASDAGRSDARVRWLTAAEAALDDGAAGVGTRLTAIFTTADALASDPGGDMPRRAMLSAIEDAAATIRTSAEALATTADTIAREAQADVDAINANLAALAKVNVGLLRAGVGTSAHAQLSDERDRLIDGIADKIGIAAKFDNNGVATVTLAGATGATLLEGATAALLGLDKATNGRLSVVMSGTSAATPVFPVGGSLAGLIDVAAAVSDRRAQLDSIAADFVAALNGWNAQGIDANGQPGGPLLAIGVGAATLQLAIGDPDLIAAASTDGVGNGNLLTLGALRGAGGAEERWAGLVNSHAQMLASAKSENSAVSARRDGAFAARDDIAGIDLDREAAELIRFQQAYDGSAKIIQVARETLQSILALF